MKTDRWQVGVARRCHKLDFGTKERQSHDVDAFVGKLAKPRNLFALNS
jgi:hypothetical protein